MIHYKNLIVLGFLSLTSFIASAETLRLPGNAGIELSNGLVKFRVGDEVIKANSAGLNRRQQDSVFENVQTSAIPNGYKVTADLFPKKGPKKKMCETETTYVVEGDHVVIRSTANYLAVMDWHVDFRTYFALIGPDKDGIDRDLKPGSTSEVTYAGGSKKFYKLEKEEVKGGLAKQVIVSKGNLRATVEPGKDTKMYVLDTRTLNTDSQTIMIVSSVRPYPEKYPMKPGDKETFETIIRVEKNSPSTQVSVETHSESAAPAK